MKIMTKKQIIVVKESNPEAFEKALNECFSLLLASGVGTYDLRFNDSLGLCAYVVFDEVKRVPETLSEMAVADGNAYECDDCIHFEKSSDNRRKYHFCQYYGERVRADKMACDAFYKYGFTVDSDEERTAV